MKKTAIKRAVDRAGGQTALARSIGKSVKQQNVWWWVSTGVVPPEHCLAIEQATGISRHELRPDVFGPPPDSLPSDQEGVSA